MYLELAENNTTGAGLSPYIMLPNGKYVREDYFDNLPPSQWEAVMDQIERGGGMAEYLADRSTRRARKQARVEKKQAKADIKRAKAESIRSGQAGGRFDWNKAGDILKNVTGAAAGILLPGANIPGITPGGAPAPEPEATKPSFWEREVIFGLTGKQATIGAAALGLGIYAAKKAQLF